MAAVRGPHCYCSCGPAVWFSVVIVYEKGKYSHNVQLPPEGLKSKEELLR